jgi:uncharacterized protein YndB with AHSA1/START domain
MTGFSLIWPRRMTMPDNVAEDVAADREIVVTRLIDAPRELVFDAFTHPAHVSRWWGPHGFTTTTQSMDVRPGGAWTFVMHGPDGTDYDNRIVYEDVVRPERLIYRHEGEAGDKPVRFRTTVTFVAEGRRTRITLRAVFATAAERAHVARKHGAVEGAQQTVARLADYVERRTLDSSPGAEFVITRELDAPRERVFDMWTKPQHLQQWFSPKGFSVIAAKMDLRPGGFYHWGMRTPDGKELWGKWLLREIVRPARLVYINAFSDPQGNLARHPFNENWPSRLLTTITFEERARKTLVTVRWSPYEATVAERATFDAGHDSMRTGWGGTLEQLDAHVARQR